MTRVIFLCVLIGTAGLLLGSLISNPDAGWNAQSTAAQPETVTESGFPGKWEADRHRDRPLTSEEETNIFVYEHANPSVVNISTRSVQIDHFLMLQREAEGSGSGAVLDKAGHILTNFHVVEGAKNVEVTLASTNTYSAELIGHDREQDIAILQIEAPQEELVPISLGDSNNLRVGQKVYVLGNPFSWEGTLTTGIISSLNRDLPSRVRGRVMQSLIQTDAAMNPGNSGGPMLDTSARMIGMCVAIATKTGQNAGVGFAIPIDRIKRIVPELIEHGKVIRADIGITHVIESENGLIIARLDPEGPAAKAGLQGFRRVVQRRQQGPIIYETETIDRSHADRILAVNGEPMRTGVQFRDKIWEFKPGDVINLTILRDGREVNVEVTLGAE